MSTAHHPDETLLWDYFRGALAPGIALSVRTHLDLCGQCHGGLGVLTAAGGVMLDTVAPVAMSDSALDLALARIERPEEPVPTKAPHKRPAFLDGFELPETLKHVRVKNRYFVAPGVWLAPIDIDQPVKGSKTYLMFVKAGMAMPHHTHRGLEINVMLQGQYKDHKGTYTRGDFAVCDDSDDRHNPAMEGDVDCLCLVAQENAIVPQTLLGWLLKPIARI